MATQVLLLDATLRDGGMGLEDFSRNHFSDKCYTDVAKRDILRSLKESDLDIVELGAIGRAGESKGKFAIYPRVEDLSRFLPTKRSSATMYAGMYIGPDRDVQEIPAWNSTLVEGARVILRYSELEKSLEYCAALSRKGYLVFIQPMLTMRYTNDELDLIIRYANEMGAYACYFVDSYGYMNADDITRLFDYYDKKLDKSIRIGFHAHNNMSLAYANALAFLNRKTERTLIVDSCVTGMGQGAGNLQTELIVPYLNAHFGKRYSLGPILDICDYLEREMLPTSLWGYSVTCMLPALYKTAYKYSLVMRLKYHMSFRDINETLKKMPDSLRCRYTPESLEYILSLPRHT